MVSSAAVALAIALATQPVDNRRAESAINQALKEIKYDLPIAKPTRPAVKTVLRAGEHSHKCANCGTLWVHTDSSRNNVRDHLCPNCGVLQWDVFEKGPALPVMPVYQRNCPT
jgi:predicted RNA-binding Zn-ribbon protein involved in translation (DUF1610 family)